MAGGGSGAALRFLGRVGLRARPADCFKLKFCLNGRLIVLIPRFPHRTQVIRPWAPWRTLSFRSFRVLARHGAFTMNLCTVPVSWFVELVSGRNSRVSLSRWSRRKMFVQIRVPPGVFAGQEFEFLSPSGEVSRVRVPVGVRPGDEFVAQLAPAPPPVPMGAPVHLGAPAQTGGMGGGPTPLPATRARPLPAAARYAECPICFEPLHAGPVGVFLDGSGKRVSQHFFRLDAAREWLASGNGMCPITRAPIRSVRPVPNVQTDPDGWFAVCDVDGNGKLSRKEAIECIKAQYACDVAQLDAALTDEAHRMWRQWDVDGSGFIERHELLASPNGLALSVPRLFPPPARGTMPNMRTDKGAWCVDAASDGL